MSQMTLDAAKPVAVNLLPGEYYFGEHNTRIQTLLGSCVSVTVWHPQLHIGGMSHAMLPSRDRSDNQVLDGRYADESIELLLREISKRNTRPEDYQVKLFGGGNMFQQFRVEGAFNVAVRNIEAVKVLLKARGFDIHAEHVGGTGHRVLVFDLRDGYVWVKHEKV